MNDDRQKSYEEGEKMEKAGQEIFNSLETLNKNTRLSLLVSIVSKYIQDETQNNKEKGHPIIKRFNNHLSYRYDRICDIVNKENLQPPAKLEEIIQ